MDENGRYLTAGELAMWEQRGGYGYDCHKGSGKGMAAVDCQKCSRSFVSETPLTLTVA